MIYYIMCSYSIRSDYTEICCVVIFCAMLYYVAVYFSILFYIALHYMTSYCISQWCQLILYHNMLSSLVSSKTSLSYCMLIHSVILCYGILECVVLNSVLLYYIIVFYCIAAHIALYGISLVFSIKLSYYSIASYTLFLLLHYNIWLVVKILITFGSLV